MFCDPLRPRGPAVNFQSLAASSHIRRMPAPMPPIAAEFVDAEYSALERAWLRNIFRRAGLPMEAYKPESLRRRKPACLRALGAGSMVEARLLLSRRPDRLDRAMSALLIGVTDFFRDPPVFEALEGLLKTGPVARPPRVWSAGCSNGAELYSIAMLLDRAGMLEGARLLGSDCRLDAVAQAAEGCYDLSALASIPPDLQAAYCQVEGSKFRVGDRLRRAVRFVQANVLASTEPGCWDLILCRNLAIYLQPAAVGQLWLALEGALAPGGLLMLGKAERPTGTARLRPAGPMIWRRTEGR
ncbi:MAG TPA: CheR family methyltransferase [Tepidisphaeraceae bacterium]|nr:CheR family methyltransferase [Tepidisphaeraceae bacterium]